MTARHESVLRALLPLVIEGDDPAQIAVDATLLDAAQDELFAVEGDVFVSSTTHIERWEAVYGLAGNGTQAERRAAVLAAKQAQGGISRQYFLDLADSMGYAVQIANGVYPFRAGISVAGDPVKAINTYSIPDPPGWDQSISGPYAPDLFIWRVYVQALGLNPNSTPLKAAFLAKRPPFTAIEWTEASVVTLLGAS